MNILVVGNYFYPEHTGGVETVSHNLVNHYREAGQKVRWVAADVAPRFRAVKIDDVPIHAWNITEEKFGFPQPIPYPSVVFKLYSNVHWCDIVHLQDCLYIINILTFFIAKFLGKPILITQYAKVIPYSQFYKRALQKMGYYTVGRLMFTLADLVVFITSNVRDGMQHINPSKMRKVVPLGVDTDFYSPLSALDRIRLRNTLIGDSSKPIILFVGRMVERKGIHLIRPLIQKHQEWHWLLVGRPDDFNPGEWGYSNISYFPYATEHQLREFYGCADVLVHPSIGEGLTLVVAESLAAGTPVVVSEESLYEIDKTDRNLFFASLPESKSIEENLIRAFADPLRLSDLRIACREYALSRLSWVKMAQRYMSLLQSILERD